MLFRQTVSEVGLHSATIGLELSQCAHGTQRSLEEFVDENSFPVSHFSQTVSVSDEP